jgi:microsomal dipeptidase-like Zn-dependent dipeptidase
VFAATTRTPWGLNYASNRADAFDTLVLLTFFQRWPPATWTSPLHRALHIAARLHDAAARSGGGLRVITTAADLRTLRADRAAGGIAVGGLLALEGSHPLEGDLANLDRLGEAGYRMAAPAHFFDNEVGGSAHGVDKGGLTPLGRAWVPRMEEKGMVIDLAHASARTFDEVLALAHRPVVVSHTGVRATCDTPRNLSDAQLRAVAETGGVIGIGFWPDVLCGDDPPAIARAIRHAVDVAGIDHVALGSDFDGTVSAPFDATGLDQVTAALQAAGFDDAAVAKIMGRNALRVLESGLPPG